MRVCVYISRLLLHICVFAIKIIAGGITIDLCSMRHIVIREIVFAKRTRGAKIRSSDAFLKYLSSRSQQHHALLPPENLWVGRSSYSLHTVIQTFNNAVMSSYICASRRQHCDRTHTWLQPQNMWVCVRMFGSPSLESLGKVLPPNRSEPNAIVSCRISVPVPLTAPFAKSRRITLESWKICISLLSAKNHYNGCESSN